jgi:hypothetical protein
VVTALSPGQYQLSRDDGSRALTYGAGAGYVQVQATAWSPGSMTVQDQQVTGHDGVLFGADTQAGAMITQEGTALTAPGTGYTALDAFDALAAAWNDPVIRLTPGRYQVLRVCYRGSLVTRRVYGRGRAITPAYGQVSQGAVPFVAAFQVADNNVYDDTVLSVTMAGTPATRPVAPLTPPGVLPVVLFAGQSSLTVGGTVATWPVITMTGLAVNPRLTFTGTGISVGWTGTIPAGKSLVIDTRPWQRTALLSGAQAAGPLAGSPMIAMQLQPGTTQASYAVSSGYSLCTISWSNAVQALGGTL